MANLPKLLHLNLFNAMLKRLTLILLCLRPVTDRTVLINVCVYMRMTFRSFGRDALLTESGQVLKINDH